MLTLQKKKRKSNTTLKVIVQRLTQMGITAEVRGPTCADFELGFIGVDESGLSFIHFDLRAAPSIIAKIAQELASVNNWTIADVPMMVTHLDDRSEILFDCDALAALAEEILTELKSLDCDHAHAVTH